MTALHMYDARLDARESKVRRFIVRHFPLFEKLLQIKQADFSACRDETYEAPCVTKWKKIYEDMRGEGVPFTVKQLDVRGDELIAAGIAPQDTGAALQGLLECCAVQRLKNEKSKLIDCALKMRLKR